jgi:hypothetical protein
VYHRGKRTENIVKNPQDSILVGGGVAQSYISVQIVQTLLEYSGYKILCFSVSLR